MSVGAARCRAVPSGNSNRTLRNLCPHCRFALFCRFVRARNFGPGQLQFDSCLTYFWHDVTVFPEAWQTVSQCRNKRAAASDEEQLCPYCAGICCRVWRYTGAGGTGNRKSPVCCEYIGSIPAWSAVCLLHGYRRFGVQNDRLGREPSNHTSHMSSACLHTCPHTFVSCWPSFERFGDIQVELAMMGTGNRNNAFRSLCQKVNL